MKALFTHRRAANLLLGLALPFSFAICRAEDPEAIVREIRTLYDKIEGTTLRAREIEFSSKQDPLSGTFIRYFQGDELVKIKLAYQMGDHGGSDEYYYYDQGKLFFVFATDSAWSFSGEILPNGESGTVDTAGEHRVYLHEGAPVRHLYREVKSKDPAALTALLKEASNVPGEDRERLGRLIAVGKALWGAENGDAVLKVLLP